MKHSKVFLALAGLSLILTVACGQKKDDSPAGVSGAGGAVNVEAGAPGFPMMPYNRQMVNITGTDQNQFNQAAKTLALADPSLHAADIGTINGVTLQGDVVVDQNNGNVIIGNQTDTFSNIQILITDSWVGSPSSQGGTIQPISVFVRAKSGRAAKGNVSLVFGDNLGDVIVNGTYNSTTFQGTVSFRNANGASGTLGKFSVNTCSFFRCM